MSSNVGAALLKMHTDEISRQELRAVLEELRDNSRLRAKCSTLGHLVADIPIEKRQEYARACVDTLLAFVPPRRSSGKPGVEVTKAFYCNIPILRSSEWFRHSEVLRTVVVNEGKRKKKQYKAFSVSPALAEVVRAIEELWGVQGHLILPSE